MFPILAGCGAEREAGPLAGDRGEITFWHVTDSSFSLSQCTDAASWQNKITAPSFPDNSYLIYKVSLDGMQATAQNCTTTQASSCSDSATGIGFVITGHRLTYDPAPDTSDIAGFDCDLSGDQLWTVEDKGETATLDVVNAFSLVGDTSDCQTVENQVAAESTNGLGFNGCQVKLSVELEFFSTQAP